MSRKKRKTPLSQPEKATEKPTPDKPSIERLAELRGEPVWNIVLGTIFSLAISLIAVLLLTYFRSSNKTVNIVIHLGAWLLSYIIPAIVVFSAMRRAFRRRSEQRRLPTILTSYAALILIFSGLYFSMSYFGDYNDKVEKFNYYKSICSNINAHLAVNSTPWRSTGRAFSGIEYSMWTWDSEPSDDVQLSQTNGTELAETTKGTAGSAFDSIRPNWENSRFVLLDCLHLSISTMTTLGLGDITPKSWDSKLATDIQVLSGQALLVVALGMFLAGRFG
jgi:amino acid transporter